MKGARDEKDREAGGGARRRLSPTVRASLAVAAGDTALGVAPFLYVMTQPVASGDGWSGLLFGAAFLFSVGSMVMMPEVCFGLLAPGSESVSTNVAGDTEVSYHSVARARRAARWLVGSVALMALSLAAMPRTP